MTGRPHELQILYSQHYCSACDQYFNADLSDVAPPRGHYTHRVMALAVRVVVEDGLPYRAASWHLWRDHRVFVPSSDSFTKSWITTRRTRICWPFSSGFRLSCKHVS